MGLVAAGRTLDAQNKKNLHCQVLNSVRIDTVASKLTATSLSPDSYDEEPGPAMRSTPQALLSRVRNQQDHDAWRDLDAHYRDLLINFCRRRGVPLTDSEDIVQGVFISLTRSLPQFIYDRNRGRFRDYLFTCVRNSISLWSARPNRRWEPLDNSGEPNPGAAAGSDGADWYDARIWEEEWVAHHYRLAMKTIRDCFDERSIAIFDRSIAGTKPADLAREFAISEQAVHKVRQRIRDRMEELIAQQVRDEDAVDEPPPG